ncbi:HD domain-containing protein [Nocardia sp. NPDC052566]|uniref:HD domain-containing protein n=1 Tax=Nocardia sp. NPDC052566 TaxID=3364330 RepID=UPI0037C65117
MTSRVLEHALTDRSETPLRLLPDRAAAIIRALDAPPRLAAHLRAVHDVACQLVDWLTKNYGTVRFDADSVLFGAAIHDIGKVRHPAELSGPGSAHEPDGYKLLLDHGVPENAARFARTHAAWNEPTIDIEDLLVSLADKIWKAKRVPELEQLIVRRLATASGQQPWQVFMTLDEELDRIASDADQRLAFQSAYPITT